MLSRNRTKSGRSELRVINNPKIWNYQLRLTKKAAYMLEAIQPVKLTADDELSFERGGDLKVIRSNGFSYLKGKAPARVHVEMVSIYGTVFELKRDGDRIKLKGIGEKA